jgi:metal-sulfur cluster biosynthetic enzyme
VTSVGRGGTVAAREAQVWARLDLVDDPELDEPLTALGFVEQVRVSEEGDVDVAFRLPTYWCAPNFAFLMAEDIRREVAALTWVKAVTVRILDHLWGEEIADGVNRGRSFAQVFGGLTDGRDLGELRATFAGKAFLRRQEAVLGALRGSGLDDARIVAMRLGELDALDLPDAEGPKQKARYREALLRLGLAEDAGDLAFPTARGEPIPADGLPAHLAALRSVRLNMEFSAALCRGLARARYRERAPGAEPDLIDFMQGPVPPPSRPTEKPPTSR